MDKIAPLGAAAVSPAGSAIGAPRTVGGDGGFGTALRKAIDSVNADQNNADRLQRRFQLGDPGVSLEEAMLATQTASISFQGLVQVRNRLVSAYHDIMNMQV